MVSASTLVLIAVRGIKIWAKTQSLDQLAIALFDSVSTAAVGAIASRG